MLFSAPQTPLPNNLSPFFQTAAQSAIEATIRGLLKMGPTPPMLALAIRHTEDLDRLLHHKLATETMKLLPTVSDDHAEDGLQAISDIAREYHWLLIGLARELGINVEGMG